MAHYRFESAWELNAPADRVFELLTHPQNFKDWWPSITDSRLLDDGDAAGVGARAVFTLRIPFLYSISFQTTALEVEPPRRIHALVRGHLVGTGTYLVQERPASTEVRFLWLVSTTKTWMNMVAPLVRPIFVWAHHHVIRRGAAAMATRLGVRLTAIRTRVVASEPAEADETLADDERAIVRER